MLTWSARTCANSAKRLGISSSGVGARIDSRKWLMGKRVPKKYGEKVEQTVQGPEGDLVQQQTTYRYIIVRPRDSNSEGDH